MSKNTKRAVFTLMVIGVSLVAVMIIGGTRAIQSLGEIQAQRVDCPEGTRPSGGGGCFIEPSGCPFGDAIPLEKCTDYDGNPWPYEDEQYVDIDGTDGLPSVDIEPEAVDIDAGCK